MGAPNTAGNGGPGQRAVRADTGERHVDGGVTIDEVLAHFGVKGMRWGVRKDRSSSTTPATSGHSHGSSEDAVKAEKYKQAAKTSGTHVLANHELQHLVNRINLEQQYSRLTASGSKKSAGAKFAKDILVQVGKQQITKVLVDATGKAVANSLKR